MGGGSSKKAKEDADHIALLERQLKIAESNRLAQEKEKAELAKKAAEAEEKLKALEEEKEREKERLEQESKKETQEKEHAAKAKASEAQSVDASTAPDEEALEAEREKEKMRLEQEEKERAEREKAELEEKAVLEEKEKEERESLEQERAKRDLAEKEAERLRLEAEELRSVLQAQLEEKEREAQRSEEDLYRLNELIAEKDAAIAELSSANNETEALERERRRHAVERDELQQEIEREKKERERLAYELRASQRDAQRKLASAGVPSHYVPPKKHENQSYYYGFEGKTPSPMIVSLQDVERRDGFVIPVDVAVQTTMSQVPGGRRDSDSRSRVVSYAETDRSGKSSASRSAGEKRERRERRARESNGSWRGSRRRNKSLSPSHLVQTKQRTPRGGDSGVEKGGKSQDMDEEQWVKSRRITKDAFDYMRKKRLHR